MFISDAFHTRVSKYIFFRNRSKGNYNLDVNVAITGVKERNEIAQNIMTPNVYANGHRGMRRREEIKEKVELTIFCHLKIQRLQMRVVFLHKNKDK